MNWEKLGSIHSSRPNFQSMDELGKVCPNLIFTVKNKMGYSHKNGWLHFKLNIND